MTERKHLCLIDGSGYIYRAFYAIPTMTRSSDNLPVNAVYGFTSMLMQFVSENKADCLAVVFDAKRSNFRNDIYPLYKANRHETPPELAPQFPLIRQAVDAFDVASVEEEGFEADDLIASYTQKALEDGMDVTVVTADKDLMQLMNNSVQIYDPMKKKILTEDDVRKKFGVLPSQVVEVQSLMGDTSDNVPGVKGIGPKTAAELILSFGDLETLYQNLDKVSNARWKQLLLENKENAFISKKLVSLAKDAPLPKPIQDFCCFAPNSEKINAFLDENGFKNLKKRVGDFVQKRSCSIHQAKPEPKPRKYTCIQTEKELESWIKRVKQKGYVALDTETDSLDSLRANITGMSISLEPFEACYIPLAHVGENEKTDLFNYQSGKVLLPQVSKHFIREKLLPVLKDVLKIGHNLKYDLEVISHNFDYDISSGKMEDTMIMSYDLTGITYGRGLEELSEIYLGEKGLSYEDVCGKGRTAIPFAEVPLDKATQYACEDADFTLRLYQILKEKLIQEKKEDIYRKMDIPLIRTLMAMEQEGILTDQKALEQMQVDFSGKIAALEKKIYEQAGEVFNINSPAQLGKILFEKMNLSGGKKTAKSQNWTTDSDILETLAADGVAFAQSILDYRQYNKLKSTYIDSLLILTDEKTKRVHTHFSQTVTATGRLSSNNPNLQNIPVRTEEGRQIRSAFIAKEGCVLMSADYSQIELRLMAAVADVKALKEAFLRGEDIHAATASQVFGIPLDKVDAATRRSAKAINFGIIYGISPFGLARQLGISRGEAKNYIDSYFSKYPEIKEYMDKTIEFASQNNYVLTPFGRKCFISGFESQATKGFASRAAINAPIQGGAADIVKMAMNKVYDLLKEGKYQSKMLLQVHDELVLEVPNDEVERVRHLLKETMENVVNLSVPFIVEIGTGKNWTEAH